MPALEQGGSNSGNIISGAQLVTTKTPLTGLSPQSATVTGTSAVIVGANADRKGLIIKNLSSDYISLAFATTAVINNGITLTPLSSFAMDEYCYSTQAIEAVSSGTSSDVAYEEFQ